MKIQDIQGTGVRQLQTETTGAAGPQTAKPAEDSQDSAADSISVSREAKLMQKAGDVIAQTPDIRSDKVDPLNQAIAQGVYGVDAQKVANSMIANMIMEH